jgi:hypothetical protein
MKTIFKGFPVIFLMILSFSSCVKQEQETDETDSTSENFTATSIASDMGNISDEAGRTNAISSFRSSEESAVLSSCASLKFDTIVHTNPDSITVNFGANNCLCNDERYRRGSLLITFNGKYKDSLTTITITSQNYFVNDHGVKGTKITKNLGHNAQGHLVYDLTENIEVTKTNGGVIKLDAKRQREWISGENTLIWSDDKYSITGSASGTNSNGRSFTSLITKPLIRDMRVLCRKNFVSGAIQHTPFKKPTRTIDFGNGDCTNKATVTINGRVYDITLP